METSKSRQLEYAQFSQCTHMILNHLENTHSSDEKSKKTSDQQDSYSLE